MELVLRQTNRIVRMDRGVIIVETGPGWICANAGLDESNSMADDLAILLPVDADASATQTPHRYSSVLAVPTWRCW